MRPQIPIHRFTGRGTLLVNLLARFASHAPPPIRQRRAFSALLFIFAAGRLLAWRLGRHIHRHALARRLFDFLLNLIAAVDQMLMNFLSGALLHLLAHGPGEMVVIALASDLDA